MRRGQHYKRKRGQHNQFEERSYDDRLQDHQRALAVLHIQAHEADIVHGAIAKARAQSLEVDRSSGKPGPRTALIKLESTSTRWDGGEDPTDLVFSLGAGSDPNHRKGKQNMTKNTLREEKEVWVDRYDARLLLDSFTALTLGDDTAAAESYGASEPASPASSSWSDFPEDSRETFFLSQSQTEDFHLAKRRRLLDAAYERRLREREAEDAQDALEDAAVPDVGEIPSETLLLMQRTANHLLSATNPAQLEMRILANHGADQRFAFLRDGGKWHAEWIEVKAKLNAEKEKERLEKEAQNAKKGGGGLGGLTGYGSDSDSGDTSDEPERDDIGALAEGPPEPTEPPPPPPIPPPPLPDSADGHSGPTDAELDALKEERRARAREWMLSRRSEKQDST